MNSNVTHQDSHESDSQHLQAMWEQLQQCELVTLLLELEIPHRYLSDDFTQLGEYFNQPTIDKVALQQSMKKITEHAEAVKDKVEQIMKEAAQNHTITDGGAV